MNLTSGIFSAPRPGIYFFSFAGLAHISSSSPFYSNLYLNGNLIRRNYAFVGENKNPVDQYSPLTFQWTLNLKKGDQVWVGISYSGTLSSLFESYTHFTGFMLEEEIVASF
jgi:hypothetical protein